MKDLKMKGFDKEIIITFLAGIAGFLFNQPIILAITTYILTFFVLKRVFKQEIGGNIVAIGIVLPLCFVFFSFLFLPEQVQPILIYVPFLSVIYFYSVLIPTSYSLKISKNLFRNKKLINQFKNSIDSFMSLFVVVFLLVSIFISYSFFYDTINKSIEIAIKSVITASINQIILKSYWVFLVIPLMFTLSFLVALLKDRNINPFKVLWKSIWNILDILWKTRGLVVVNSICKVFKILWKTRGYIVLKIIISPWKNEISKKTLGIFITFFLSLLIYAGVILIIFFPIAFGFYGNSIYAIEMSNIRLCKLNETHYNLDFYNSFDSSLCDVKIYNYSSSKTLSYNSIFPRDRISKTIYIEPSNDTISYILTCSRFSIPPRNITNC